MAGVTPRHLVSANMIKTFYEKVLPSQGVYCVTSIGKNGVRNLFADTLDDLLVHIEEAKRKEDNVFVALNSFAGHSRKADNAVWARSFFIDLDVGTTKQYKSQDEALADLQTFLDKTGLPPPVRVNSGNGIHAYWAFDNDVNSREWKTYAEKFKTYCIENGLAIDPTVTADAARIMRCPDTVNYKGDPIPTSLIDTEFTGYSFNAFKEFLGIEDTAIEDIFAQVVTDELDLDTAAVARRDENFEYVFADIAIKSMQGQGCNQIKYILENAATLTEPMWYAGLSVAVRCSDGASAIHLMSQDYEGYNHDETERKAAQSLREATWAHGCDAFNRENPNTCNTCPFRGEVTSPIRLGRKLKEAPAEETDPDAVREEDVEEKFTRLPKELWPFSRGAHGGIYFVPPPKVDKDGISHDQDPIRVFDHDIYAIKRVVGGSEGDALVIRNITPFDPQCEFQLPIRSVYVQDEMKKILPANNAYPRPRCLQAAADYFFAWATYLQNKEAAEVMRKQMGWTEDKSSFALGQFEIDLTGEERPIAPSPMTKNLAKMITRAGSYEVWQEAINKLNEPGWEMVAFATLMGFGSTIMYLTPVPGATICYSSANSGTGKSASLYAGLSVFGKTRDTSVMEGASTSNGYIGRYLGMKNLMFGVDEASNIEPKALSYLLHQISQGKAKIRMQSSVNAEREVEQSASLLMLITANLDMYDRLRTYKASPDGEMARLLQFMLTKPPQLEADSAAGRVIIQPLHSNYGHAGPEFIKYFYRMGEAYVLHCVEKWCARISKELSDKSEYRHYVAALAATFAAAELAVEADIIKFDVERIYKVILLETIRIVDSTARLNKVDYKAVLAEFINKYHAGFLILNDDRVVSEPRTALIGKIEVHNQVQYISKTAFRAYLSELQVSSNEFETALGNSRDGTFAEKKVRLTSGWKDGMKTNPIACYSFSTALTEDLLKELKKNE